MLTVETYLDKSPGRGIGLFAKTDIRKGTTYWIRNEAFDKIISPEEIDLLPHLSMFFVKNYAFLENTGKWYLCSDNDRFCNHSYKANTTSEFDQDGLIIKCTALQDIKAGEEIFCNYMEICRSCIHGVDFEEC